MQQRLEKRPESGSVEQTQLPVGEGVLLDAEDTR